IHESPSYKYFKKANESYLNEHQHHDDLKHSYSTQANTLRRAYNIILRAVGSTLIVCVPPLSILFFPPLMERIINAEQHKFLLKILLSIASGGLLGDAFLYLILHAMIPHSHKSSESHSHSHSHSYHDESKLHNHGIYVGLCILLGIIVFLMVEKAARIIKGDHSHSHVHHDSQDKKDNLLEKKKEKKEEKKNSGKTVSKAYKAPESEIKIAGYLNLVADFLHNFTDGLAIGASYMAGNNIGYVTTFTILIHEIPHEIGDFAILIQSGYSKRKAMMLQLTTAIGVLLGTFVCLLAKGMDDFATRWNLPFSARGFIYIGTISY
ncbi:Zinc transporter SLC39A7, partial [Cyphomyrmex costatus]